MTEYLDWNSMVQWPDAEDYNSFLEPISPPFSQVLSSPFIVKVKPEPSPTSALISPTFCQSASWHGYHGIPDAVFCTSDSVLFFVHSQDVLAASDNGFCSLIPSCNPVIIVTESSATLNIMLHAIYNLSYNQSSYTFEDLSKAIDRFAVYGMHPKTLILTSTSLYTLLLSYAPYLPLLVYTCASKHDLQDLAVSSSSHLLSFKLSALTDEMAEAIGPSYLRRLFFLQMGRSEALKRLLLYPPSNHTPTANCNVHDQNALTRAWALASAYLVWDSRPDLSTNSLESTFSQLVDDLSCDLCKKNLNERIKELSICWSQVKRTI
ncbi:hypothetical protein C8J55DRAFT_605386 [Lentinula edodes]|uniref:BTB domain-containing protein n=1 Tax=Lentinula lateritia TaxID=40482 RepID=A0A9W9AHU7_9AGAR|nr:hypothetical protein C8J55DRAFT_605386 [Lentinula edodes]